MDLDSTQYNTLLAALSDMPDPRKARGKQHEWRVLLAILCGALLSGHKTVWAMAQWVREHACELIELLAPSRSRLPSASTLYRLVRTIDVRALECRLAHYAQSLQQQYDQQQQLQLQLAESNIQTEAKPEELVLVGQAVDGKEIRGARSHGQVVHLVSLVRHQTGVVLGQRAVDGKSNEIKAVPHLLEGRDLTGTVTTMDALLTQRSIAQQILRQSGHYLMVVKGNQRELCLTIAELFASPPWLPHESKTYCRKYSQVHKGHGRLETRTLESSWALNEYVSGYLDWPGSKQVLRRTCRRVILKTGQVSEQVTYGITSLGWDQADAREIERLWRGHWTIENRSHYVRDVTMGEDANQMRVGNAPQVLAALRNGLVSLLRVSGWQSIAEGLRHYGASVHCALHLINSPLLRL